MHRPPPLVGLGKASKPVPVFFQESAVSSLVRCHRVRSIRSDYTRQGTQRIPRPARSPRCTTGRQKQPANWWGTVHPRIPWRARDHASLRGIRNKHKSPFAGYLRNLEVAPNSFSKDNALTKCRSQRLVCNMVFCWPSHSHNLSASFPMRSTASLASRYSAYESRAPLISPS